MGYKDFSIFNRKSNQKPASRSQKKVANNLGIISLPLNFHDRKFRDPQLEIYDAYYEKRQYDHLIPWDQNCDRAGNYVRIRDRKPRIIVGLAKSMAHRVTAMCLGGTSFPTFPIPDFPDEQEFIKAVVRESRIKALLLEPFRRMLNTGSTFVRFRLTEGALKLEWFHAKYCYPKFSPSGELIEIEIKYVFEDKNDPERDEFGNFKKKWFKMILGQMSEVIFDNPEFHEDSQVEPEFEVINQVDHGFGFVQGVWFRTSEERNSPDGYAMVPDISDFVDELSYSLSQSSRAVGYNQDPQTWTKGMDQEEVEELIKSATKVWNLGRNGEAGHLETNMSGVQVASEMRDKVIQAAQHEARVLLLDPEKIVGSAQSAKAMEILHGPMVQLVEEIRNFVEPQVKELVLKMATAILMAERQGMEIPIEMPPGWTPATVSFDLKWGAMFEKTLQDKQQEAAFVNTLTAGNLISRETGTRYLAQAFPELGIDDVEAEIQKVNSQPQLNPFGGF